MNKILKAHLALLIANLIYSASFTIAKEVMPVYIQPFGFVLVRAAGAAGMFWLISLFIEKEKISRPDFTKFFLLAVFGVAVNQLLFLKGLSLSTPINAAIIMVTTPILVLIIAGILHKEKLHWLNITGIITGFSGALLLLLVNADLSFGSETALGDTFVFINALSWGIYLILVKPLMQQYQTVTILKWVFLFGTLLVFPFGIQQLAAVDTGTFNVTVWWHVLFIVVGTTVIAYLLNTYALKELSSSVVSAYIYLQPLLAGLIAICAQKDTLNWIKVVATLLIFAGVYMASKRVIK